MFGFGYNMGATRGSGTYPSPAYATPPVVTSPDDPIVEGSTLNVSNGTWLNYNAPLTYTYQWYKNGVAIGGATTNSYVTTDQGSYYAIVTATNSLMNSTSARSNTIVIGTAFIITESGDQMVTQGGDRLITD